MSADEAFHNEGIPELLVSLEEDFIDPKFIRSQSITCFFPSQDKNGEKKMKQ